ncbi:hypothetical protein ACQP1G_20720 [Nocardia sp. CA-107356]|uniref:hypothetical protein n=1 Tax=Nocardia sp. CA-107356 TaxID=3239972 RepID=UPI003D8A3880
MGDTAVGSVHAGSGVFWLACVLLLAVAAICGLLAGFLSWRGGANVYNAALFGFGAFGGTTGLGLAFITLVTQ